MEKEKKIYCGSGKSPMDGIINISICLSDLPTEHIYKYKGKKYINLTVGKKREIDKFGKSHSVSVNTWKPENKPSPPRVDNETSDDLPF